MKELHYFRQFYISAKRILKDISYSDVTSIIIIRRACKHVERAVGVIATTSAMLTMEATVQCTKSHVHEDICK